LEKCKEEAEDYEEAGIILKKYASGEDISKDEMQKVHNQLIDTLKIGGSGLIFMLPFGSILIVALLKYGDKIGINFLPSAWSEKEK